MSEGHSDGAVGARASTVFIVEDDLDVSDVVAEILRDVGFEVVCVGNGQEALQYLRGNSPPALMLLDLFMPVMDGWAVLREVERDSTLSRIPVIVMTAIGGHESQRIPVSRLLRKPMDIDVLIGQVREAIEVWSAPR